MDCVRTSIATASEGKRHRLQSKVEEPKSLFLHVIDRPILPDARAVDVRRVDELRLVVEHDGRHAHADEVFSPPVASGGVVATRRARVVPDALHHHEPPRARAQHVVANALRRDVPVGGQLLAPRARVRLVLKVDGKHVPLAAERIGEQAPRLEHASFSEADRLVVPQAGPRPCVRPEPVASKHEKDAPACCFARHHHKHVPVPRLCKQPLLSGRVDDVISQNVFVVEKDSDRVELMRLQKIEIPVDVMLVETVRRPIVGL
eukprot:4574460-Pleurochrysis_carterae.AAC.2